MSRCFGLVLLSLAAAPTVAHAQIFQPGTQPAGEEGGIIAPIQTSYGCVRCHGGFDSASDHEPWDTWRGTMMGSAGRDPIFRAALAIAEQDDPDAADFCVRCHSMPAWLRGRSSLPEHSEADGPRFAPDEDGLLSDDLDGVACMVCHRAAEPDDRSILGNARMFFLDGPDSEVRQGPYAYAIGEEPSHPTRQSAWLAEGAFCGQCHDIENPVVDGRRADGTPTGRPSAIERTYSEWANSAFADRDETCQDCHMPRIEGSAQVAMDGPVREAPRRHDLVGGSTWQLRAIAAAVPDSDGELRPLYEASARRAEDMLRRAAELEIVDASLSGDTVTATVRVTNLTGHKLPTGYPEGRRMWLEVAVVDATGAVVAGSGLYQEQSATLARDDQLRTYEVKLGEGSEPSFHFVLNDTILADTRIPPEGFRAPADRDIAPVGRDYGDGTGSFRHWDEASYALGACGEGELTLRVRLRYQSTTREYIEFLRDNAPASLDPAVYNWGWTAWEAWSVHGGRTPVDMAERTTVLGAAPRPCPPLDGGSPGTLDGGAAEGGPRDGGGCGCRAAGSASAPLGWLFGWGVVAALAGWRRRFGRRSRQDFSQKDQ